MDQILQKKLYIEQNTSHQSAIDLLCSLGYIYISAEDSLLQRGSRYHMILRNILRDQIRQINQYTYSGAENEFSSENIERAIEDLDEPLTDGFIDSNEKIYSALLFGKSYPETVGDGKRLTFNFKYIDWKHPEKNIYHVTEAFAVENQDKLHNACPDIVLFINGIPFAVIECISPQISVDQAVEQIVRNQQTDYISQFYKFVQIVMVTNRNTVKYATTGTPKKFWNVWKEQNKAFINHKFLNFHEKRMPTEQDRNIIALFSLERVMELMQHFILYNANTKKICRYQQYFAIKEIVKSISELDDCGNRRSGVIWHTHGSGLSSTILFLTKYILMEMSECHPCVVIVTDCNELDKQIVETFANTRFISDRAISSRHLVQSVNSRNVDVIVSSINRFNTAERMSINDESHNVFILMDETHQPDYGFMQSKIRSVFPHVCYIGFTGTPLLKNEKNTLSKFGQLIHQYPIKNGLDDGVIVPLIYDRRFVDQRVEEKDVDLWLVQKNKWLTESQKNALEKKWNSIRKLTSIDTRIKRIALDINDHFIKGYKNVGFKAMLVANDKQDAVRYLECFQQFSDLNCVAVLFSSNMYENFYYMDEKTDVKIKAYWDKIMHQYGNVNRYEESIRNKFRNGEIDIIIVCNCLLTGLNIPICQVLYIDKELKDHSFLQAVSVINRPNPGKDYGQVVDYRGLIEKLDTSTDRYIGAGLENFDTEDLKYVVVDAKSTVEKLRGSYHRLVELFATVQNKSDLEEIEVYLADGEVREDFFHFFYSFGRSLNLVLNSEQAYVAVLEDELKKYQDAFVFFAKACRSIKIRYCDDWDNSVYELLMQNLLTMHFSVTSFSHLIEPINIYNRNDFEKELQKLGSMRAKADAITSRMTKIINENYEENPAYYDRFLKLIKEVEEHYKKKIITETVYYAKMRTIMDDYHTGRCAISYPKLIENNVYAQAFYGVLSAILDDIEPDFIAEISLQITKIIEMYSQKDWSNNKTISDHISQNIDDLFYEYEKTHGLKLSFDVIDKIIENVKTVALRTF